LVHGNQPLSTAPAKYEYVIAPNITPDAMKTLAQTLATGSIYKVLKQTDTLHAIQYIPENTTAYVFFKPQAVVNVGLVKSISNQALLSIKEYDTDKVLVTINNPNLNPIEDAVSGFVSNPLTINLGLNGNYTVKSNPNGASVNQQGNVINLGFTVKDGFETAIILQKNMLTPIRLIDFNGNYLNNSVLLNWATAEEKNVKNFVLARSEDSLTFKKIADVSAKGNSQTKTAYNFTDKDFSTSYETLYYKLQSIDNDGSISFEKTIAVKLPFEKTKIDYYPNPIASILHISFNAKADAELTVQVYSLDGKSLLKQKKIIKKGFNIIPLNLEELNTGEYIIKINGLEINSTQKIIKI
jgi:hypothetical protein